MKYMLLGGCLGLLLAAPDAAYRHDITIDRKLEAYGIRR